MVPTLKCWATLKSASMVDEPWTKMPALVVVGVMAPVKMYSQAPASEPPSEPEPGSSEPPAAAPRTDPDAAAAPNGAEATPAIQPPESVSLDDLDNDPERKAEAASYAKLVTTFMRTDFDSTRKRVARRLHAARTSDDEVTRYLAESALNRLREEGKFATFEDALGESATATT